ncbi:MAG: NAD(P)H-dependent glycerol-3-phosphate dehydrogenase [Acidimicrobiia bacterium]
MKVAVIGAGSWGTTVAAMLAPRTETVLWCRRPELADQVRNGMNPDYLPGFELPPDLGATSAIELAVVDADVVVMGVPSHGYRAVLEQAAPFLASETPILSLTKGIEQPTLMRMTEVTSSVLPEHDRSHIGALTGPNLAREIMAGQPAATVIAMEDEETATELQALFMGPRFRVYTNTDVAGAESAGALKNVMALAAGMAEGLGFGLNTVSMLMTRALVEMSRLGVAMGGRTATFAGLAGMGDLIATCMSTESRNHRVGLGLGLGKTIDEIVSEMNMVAEGVKSTEGILALAGRYGIEMPIAEQVGRVLYDNASVPEAIATLMGRSAKPE